MRTLAMRRYFGGLWQRGRSTRRYLRGAKIQEKMARRQSLSLIAITVCGWWPQAGMNWYFKSQSARTSAAGR
jgi:hypothetical protein